MADQNPAEPEPKSGSDASSRIEEVSEWSSLAIFARRPLSTDPKVRNQHKKLYSLEMELAAARNEGFVLKHLLKTNGIYSKRKSLVMIGVLTTFGRQKNRDAIRNVWMGSEFFLCRCSFEETGGWKGIVARFVIGRSENRGNNQDKDIDRENRLTNDFLILKHSGSETLDTVEWHSWVFSGVGKLEIGGQNIQDSKGREMNLKVFKGKVLLIVNVASKCALGNANYTQLTQLHNRYKDKGFEILAFPCNQFLNKEPGTSQEAEAFACERYKATFPILGK
ncbi:hypothetical protein HN51_059111, partial [Arachis hypogaea]